MSFHLYRIPTSFDFRASVILKTDISLSVIYEMSQKVTKLLYYKVLKVSGLLTKKICYSKLGIRIWSILTNLGSRYAERC